MVRHHGRRQPPGPTGLPVIGHLHMLGKLPHRSLYKLSQKYGPIMLIRLGSVPTIIVSSPSAAELFLRTHDTVFASRPNSQAYGSKGMAFAKYGSYWRSVRKFCTMELLSVAKIDSMARLRREELGLLVQSLKVAARTREVVDFSEKVARLIEDMTCRMLFGKSRDERFDLSKIIHELAEIAGAFNVADYVPFLGAFDLQGLTRRSRVTAKAFDKILETIIDDHEEKARNDDTKIDRDFVDVMLALKNNPTGTHQQLAETIDRSITKAIILDMIFGAIDTSQTAIEWIMSELIRHPRVMKRLQEEISIVVDCELVEESHLEKLDYLDMVVKETFRLHPRKCNCCYQGLTRRSRVTAKAFDKILETIIDDHEEKARNDDTKLDRDFVDVMLALKNNPTGTHQQLAETIDRSITKAIILDMIFGAIDTSQTAIEWIMSELIRHPRVMKRLQEEISIVVDCELVEESHLEKLDYLDMVVKETFRLHPVAPLLVPHESMEDIVIDGYYIEKNSRLIINNWGIGRDPRIWSENVEEFIPERFAGTDIDLRGKSFQLIPFGSGRRGCPGIHLGLINIKLVVAQLVHSFDWELPLGISPDELNMDEAFGLSLPRAEHLLAIPKFRKS
nr:PREDICTED: cytochrome P450 CYP736A12-like [Daucus carota subsp. sativus]